MILEYLRPKTIEEAIRLLTRKDPRTIPLGGGSYLSRNSQSDFAVVDLQGLGLTYVRSNADVCFIGATTTLETMNQTKEIPEGLKRAIIQEFPLNVRNTATIAGTLFVSAGNSPLAVSLMALDAEMKWLPGDQRISVGDWTAIKNSDQGVLIQEFSWSEKATVCYEGVGRTPADKPFLCVAATTWPSGRVRIVMGAEKLSKPVLVVDGKGSDGYESAIKNACSQIIAINSYITETALIITKRLLTTEGALLQ